jgi:hypothetical protein
MPEVSLYEDIFPLPTKGKPDSMKTSSITCHCECQLPRKPAMVEAILHEDLHVSLHENFLLYLP